MGYVIAFACGIGASYLAPWVWEKYGPWLRSKLPTWAGGA